MKNYNLSIVLGILFLVSWAGQAFFQIRINHDGWGDFASSTLENWQSEFLQLFSFVILSACLIHKGSPQSKDGDEEMRRMLVEIQREIAALKSSTKGS